MNDYPLQQSLGNTWFKTVFFVLKQHLLWRSKHVFDILKIANYNKNSFYRDYECFKDPQPLISITTLWLPRDKQLTPLMMSAWITICFIVSMCLKSDMRWPLTHVRFVLREVQKIFKQTNLSNLKSLILHPEINNRALLMCHT